MSTETTMTKPQAEQAERTRSGEWYRPNVDILELPDELLLVADMPGVSAETVEIHFEDRQLAITGKVAARPPAAGARQLVREYGVGDYYRTFQVSEQIDAAKISAELHDGVLTLHLPKAEAAKPRKIAVNASSTLDAPSKPKKK